MPSSNSSARSSGKVSPIDDENAQQPAILPVEHDLENGNMTVIIPNGTVNPTQPVVKSGFLSKLFKKKHPDEKGDDLPVEKKKPDGPKLKIFEIVGFLYTDIQFHLGFVIL